MWSWLSTLIPLADNIVGQVQSLLSKKTKKELIATLKKRIVKLYSDQFSEMNRDLALVAGWKPIVARVQAIDIVSRRWEYLGYVSIKHKVASILVDNVSTKSVAAVRSELNTVMKTMRDLKGGANLSWDEGGTDLVVAAENLASVLSDLESDITVHKGNDAMIVTAVISHSRNVQMLTVQFFTYWDKFLEHLHKEAAKGTKAFFDGLDPDLKLGVQKIINEYPTGTWSGLLGDLLSKIKPDDPASPPKTTLPIDAGTSFLISNGPGSFAVDLEEIRRESNSLISALRIDR